MSGEDVERLFAQLGEALDDENPAMLAVVVRANGEALAYTFPFLQRLLERDADREAAFDVVRRGLTSAAAHVEAWERRV